MGELVYAAKITHVPSMYLSEMDGPSHTLSFRGAVGGALRIRTRQNPAPPWRSILPEHARAERAMKGPRASLVTLLRALRLLSSLSHAGSDPSYPPPPELLRPHK